MASWVVGCNRRFLFSEKLHDVVFKFPQEVGFLVNIRLLTFIQVIVILFHLL